MFRTVTSDCAYLPPVEQRTEGIAMTDMQKVREALDILLQCIQGEAIARDSAYEQYLGARNALNAMERQPTDTVRLEDIRLNKAVDRALGELLAEECNESKIIKAVLDAAGVKYVD